MKLKYMFLVAAAVLSAAAVNVSAQNFNIVMAGSSALFLETGQAATTLTLPSQGGYTCWYDSGSAKSFTLTDSRPQSAYGIGNTTDTASGWIVWGPGSGSCANPAGSYNIEMYLNTDSVVGQRCYFAVPRCKVTIANPPASPGNLIAAAGQETTIPTNSTLITAINAGSGTSTNAAATDIRPEDGRFAAMRTLLTCGTPVVANSQYLGLGYQGAHVGVGVAIAGSSIQTNGSGSSFNVLDFNITGNDPITTQGPIPAFTVTAVGAVPIVVFVNPTNAGGFGSLQVSNINRAQLAGFLDGSYGHTQDIIPQTAASTDGPATVFLREPLSGTYNTMEYSIPNNIETQSSQDVGLVAKNLGGGPGTSFPPYYCVSTGGAALQNPLTEQVQRNSFGLGTLTQRGRAIGTGNMVKAVVATPDSLGYAFWSAANFAPSSTVDAQHAKYLTVDGVDPIQEVWEDGLVPQQANGQLGNVTLSHVKDGSYPIWSILRIVSDNGTTLTSVQALVAGAAKFLSPTQPDFVPLASLGVTRSHFSPPNVLYPGCASLPCPLTAASNAAAGTEHGGDVGGIVYTLLSDQDYISDTGTNGNTNRRQ
jgi:hypothetical protein